MMYCYLAPPLVSHCPELRHMTMCCHKGGWEMWFLFWKAKCLAKFEGSITICLQCRRPRFYP